MGSNITTANLHKTKQPTHILHAIKSSGEHLTLSFPEDLDELPNFEICHIPPIPPGWNDFCTNVLPTLPPKHYHQVPLASTSVEYQTLAWMIEHGSNNVKVGSIDQVINLELWEKFSAHRRDTMIAKSKNLEVLRGFGQTDFQLAQLLNNGINDPDNAKRGKVLNGEDYSDNVCLLYHCTRSKIENVLTEGLDERVGNRGFLGRGIYFTDDPDKAIQYDGQNGTMLIFMVFLGDCLSWNEIPNVKLTTREPLKRIEQARTLRDKSFDSIAGTPFAQNEFVIYNRNQCCPAFVVKYTRTYNRIENNLFDRTRKTLPEFLWKKNGILSNIPTPGKLTKPYPFYAQTIFQLIEFYNAQLRPPPPIPVPQDQNNEEETQSQKEEKLDIALVELAERGFYDVETNSKLLVEHNYNLAIVINALLESEDNKRQAGELSSGPNPKKPKMYWADEEGQ